MESFHIEGRISGWLSDVYVWYRGPDGMSNGLGDSSYGVVANVKASVLPYRTRNRVQRDDAWRKRGGPMP